MSERKRAPRREPDLDAVLAAAVESLLENGERGFRLEPIMEKTQISRSSLYLHFGDRDGLIEAASAEIFFREFIENMEIILEALEKVTTPAELRAIVRPIVQAVADAKPDTRWHRLKIFAACQHRPELLKKMSDFQTGITDKYEAMFQRYVDQGLFRGDTDVREMASLVQGLTLARVLRDLDQDRGPDSAWVDMLVRIILSFIVEE